MTLRGWTFVSVVGALVALGCGGDDANGSGGSGGTTGTGAGGTATGTGGTATGTGGTGAGGMTPDDGYFEMLVARDEHHSSTALGSEQEVADGVEFSDPADSTTTYDPALDAARFVVQPNSGSIQIGDQIRHSFPAVGSGNLFFFWEARADSYWAADGDVDGVQTYKAFQLSNGGDLTLEPRFRFAQVDLPHVARVDVRVYGSQSGVPIGPADSVGMQTGEFNILPDTWTRFWVLVDFDGDTLSYWVGDEDNATVQILDAVPFDWQQNYGGGFSFDQFWFEFNTSQSRMSDEEGIFWGRHLAILRDVEDAAELVALGSN